MRVTCLALLVGCASSMTVEDRDGRRDDDDVDSGAPDDSGDPDDTAVTLTCEELPGQQIDTRVLGGFEGSEDFAFDHDGWVVHVTDYGGLVRENADGEEEVIATGLGTASGIRVLPDGTYAVNSVDRGAILRVSADGDVTPIVTGLAYPNGLELGLDGQLHVAENGSTTVRRVDPETGEAEVIGTGMMAPNGLSFDAAHATLYVGSFGGGMIYAIDRGDDGAWDEPRIHGLKPGVVLPEDDCADLGQGDPCLIATGGYGTCATDDDGLECAWEPDLAACEGLAVGDACATVIAGAPHESVCVEDVTGSGQVWCGTVEPDRIAACEGQAVWGACTLGEERGYCEASWDGTVACITEAEYQDAWYAGCADAAVGDACVVADPVKPQGGTCTDYGYDELVCLPPWYTSAGGFDGLTADVCGNVYATEYGPGIVWRWPADGGEAEELLDFRSAWIPNMHWGLGVGGFARTSLYIMRRSGGIIEAPIGVEGKPDAYDVLHEP